MSTVSAFASVMMQVGSNSAVFMYLGVPVLYSLNSTAPVPSTGGNQFSIASSNFGLSSVSVTVRIGSVAESSVWFSDSCVAAKLESVSLGVSLALAVSVARNSTASRRLTPTRSTSTVKFERFDSISTTDLLTLKASNIFKYNMPSAVAYFSNIAYPDIYPGGLANYGARFSGMICPTVSGTYRLFLYADDGAELQIGREDQLVGLTSIITVTKSASIASSCYTASSGACYANGTNVSFTFDSSYGYPFQLLFKEYTTNDYVFLGWLPPSASSAVDIPNAAFCSAAEQVWSFYGPNIVLGNSSNNSPTTGSLTVGTLGVNFGQRDQSVRLRFGRGSSAENDLTGGSACARSLWQSTSAIGCKLAWGKGEAFARSIGLPVVVSVGGQGGSRTQAWSYDCVVVSAVGGFTNGGSSGGVSVTVAGSGFGARGYSGSARVGRSGAVDFELSRGSACSASAWQSDSAMACKIVAGVGYRAAVGFFQNVIASVFTRQGLYTRGFGFADGFIFNANRFGTNSVFVACSGSVVVDISGSSFGTVPASARGRFGFSSFSSTVWRSYSSIVSRFVSGMFSDSLLLLSVGSLINSSSLLYYNLPTPAEVSSQVISDINLSGSNFGSSLAVVPRLVNCPSVSLQPFTENTVCVHDQLSQYTQSGLSIIEVQVFISFQNALRLDDVVVNIISPMGERFLLMQNNCYGSLSCNASRTVFTFQIPSAIGTSNVPKSLCMSSGVYSSPSDAGLLAAISSYTAMGTWAVVVKSGQLALTIDATSILFRTSALQILVASSSVSSITWFSDSRIRVSAPGYQSSPRESSSGFGRNRSVQAVVFGSVSSTYCNYSYPNPSVNVTDVTLTGIPCARHVGSYFSNVDSSAKGRAGVTSCESTRWSSDTSITCFMPRFAGVLAYISISIQLSRVAASVIANVTRNVSVSDVSTNALPITGSCIVTVIGVGFGSWDSSVRARVVLRSSAAASTLWRQDTMLVSKGLPVDGRISLLQISISKIAECSTSVSSALRTTSAMVFDPVAATFVTPSTGGQLLQVTGRLLGAGASFRIRLMTSSSPASIWISDSSAICKSPSGLKSAKTTLILSVGLTAASFITSYSFSEPITLQMNFTNTSTPSFVLRGSSYGTFNAKPLISIDSIITDALWTSDSSVSCPYGLPISRDLVTLRVTFLTNTSDSMLELAHTFVANPQFVPSSKPVAQSLNCILYIPAPAMVLNAFNNYAQYGYVLAGQIFQVPSQLDVAIFQFSELINVDVVVFNNHSQVYLKNYETIPVSISGNVSVIDEQTGAIISSIICYGSTLVSAVLPANSFAVLFHFSVALCSPTDVHLVRFRYDFVALNEAGIALSFRAQSASFSVKGPSVFSLTVSKFPFSNATQANTVLAPLEIVLSTSMDYCTRLSFASELNLSCAAVSANERSASQFFASGDTCGNTSSGVTSLKQTTFGSCRTSFLLSLRSVGTCQMTISVPAMQLALTLPQFTVVHGPAADFNVIGKLSSALRGGGLIWSTNASGANCLCIRLFDGCNNTFTTNGFMVELSARLSNFSRYILLGQALSTTNNDGTVLWCSVRASLAVSMLVQVQVSWQSFQKPLPVLLNISGIGEPAALSTPAALLSNVSGAGNPLAPVTFKLQDAAGVPTYQSNVAVRVRIVLKSSIRCDVYPFFLNSFTWHTDHS